MGQYEKINIVHHNNIIMVPVIINVMIMTIVINIVLIIKSISQYNCVHDYVIVIIVIIIHFTVQNCIIF